MIIVRQPLHVVYRVVLFLQCVQQGERTTQVSSLLPEALKPRGHVNYSERLFDWDDELPKA